MSLRPRHYRRKLRRLEARGTEARAGTVVRVHRVSTLSLLQARVPLHWKYITAAGYRPALNMDALVRGPRMCHKRWEAWLLDQ